MINKNKHKISLGFTEQQFEPGVHICQIYNNDQERHDTLLDFIVTGLQDGENVNCFSENETEKSLTDYFNENGVSCNTTSGKGSFLLRNTNEVYFQDGEFNPDRMIKLLQDFYENSQKQGRSGARVLGEMSPKIKMIPGGSRLLEYESKVSILTRKYPVTTVCQYDAREFDGATIMDILKVHPYMIVRGAVVQNPFFIEPGEYLSRIKH